MTVELLPPTMPLSSLGRTGKQATIIPFSRSIRVHPRWSELQRMVYGLAQEWPAIAGAVSKVRVSRRLQPPKIAEARVLRLSTVSGEIVLSRASLQNSLLDVQLLGLHETGWSVGSNIEDLLAHEWAHLLTLMAVFRRYTYRQRELGLSELTQWVSSRAGVSADEAGAMLSHQAQLSDEELLAEAFVDARLHQADAHPFSRALWTVLQELWPVQSRLLLPRI